jgi:hypothetical protein
LNVKPSKIVAGIEAGKTNDLLQALALMLENNKQNSNSQQKNNTLSAKPEKKGIAYRDSKNSKYNVIKNVINSNNSFEEKCSTWHYFERKQCIEIYSQIRCHQQTSTQHE